MAFKICPRPSRDNITILESRLIKIWNGLDIGQQGKPKNKFGLIAHFAFLVMYLLFAVISLYTLFHNFTDKPNGREICITWLLWVGSEMIN